MTTCSVLPVNFTPPCLLLFIRVILTIVMAASWGSGWAAPRVVVSIPPVHSLVAAVMQGVGEPDLVYQAT